MHSTAAQGLGWAGQVGVMSWCWKSTECDAWAGNFTSTKCCRGRGKAGGTVLGGVLTGGGATVAGGGAGASGTGAPEPGVVIGTGPPGVGAQGGVGAVNVVTT